MYDRILVVCTGNICRSPFGERVLQKLCPGKEVASAGTGALVDHGADVTAIKIAENMGIDMRNHRAQQLTKEICRAYDLILPMEYRHQEYIADKAPEVIGKTILFGQWLGNKNIDDPYQRSEEYFQLVFEKIRQAAIVWHEKLN